MITVTIAGVDRTSSVVFNSVKKTDNLNQQVDNLTFQIRKYGSLTYKPSLGEEVVVTSGSETMFGGVIIKITEDVEASSILTYTVTCNDYSQYLKRKLVTQRYVDTTVYDIIEDIVETYLSPSDSDLANGLIAHYKLNEDAANTIVVDSSGNQAAATASQDTEDMSVAGKINTALDFNGTTDYVNIPHNANQLLTSGFTLSAWIKPDSLGEGNTGKIIDKATGSNAQAGYTLQMLTGNAIILNVNAGSGKQSAAGSVVPGDGNWYHVLVTVTAAAFVTFYINNVVSGTPGTTGALSGITTTNDIRIGNRSGATDRSFDGGIDDVRIYNRVLSAAEISKIYNEGNGTELVSDFSINHVIGDFPIESFAFNRITVAEAFQKLADAISYVWYVDYDMDIHFFPKNSELAPFNLTDTSGNYIYNSLQIVEDLSQVRNSILVQGGEATSLTTRTEYFTGDGVQESFPLANKFASVPTVVVGTTAQTVGIDNIDDDGSYEVMWNFAEKSVRFTSGNIATTDFTVAGYYLYPIVVQVPAPSSIGAFGTYEFSITDKTIASQDEAIARAVAELSSYQNELYEGSFRTYVDGLRSGMVIDITSTQRAQSISVLIQNVTTKMRDPSGNSFEYTVRFATLKSIGIIEYLQNQLRSREVIEDDQETLLNFIPTGSDTVAFADSLSTPTTSSGPYVYSNDAGTTPNKGRYSYATYV